MEWKFECFSLGVQGVLKKIYGLNYIRGICAILIVLYHYTTRYLDIVYDCGAEKGHIGVWWGCWAVSAFFILSGLLTTLNIKAVIKNIKYFVAIDFYKLIPC